MKFSESHEKCQSGWTWYTGNIRQTDQALLSGNFIGRPRQSGIGASLVFNGRPSLGI